MCAPFYLDLFTAFRRLTSCIIHEMLAQEYHGAAPGVFGRFRYEATMQCSKSLKNRSVFVFEFDQFETRIHIPTDDNLNEDKIIRCAPEFLRWMLLWQRALEEEPVVIGLELAGRNADLFTANILNLEINRRQQRPGTTVVLERCEHGSSRGLNFCIAAVIESGTVQNIAG